MKDVADQYVVEFKNKDYGSQRMFYDMLDYMQSEKGLFNPKLGFK